MSHSDDDRLKIGAGRVLGESIMPYLSHVAYAMVPVKVPGLGTFASDAKWRLYYDPALFEKWTIQEIAGVLLHEAQHCFLDHGPRFESTHEPKQMAMTWNVAADSLINVDLRDAGADLPDGAVYVDALEGCDRTMSTEMVYRILAESACTCGEQGQGQSGEGEQSEQGQGQGQGQSGEGEQSEQGQGQGQSGEGEQSEQGQGQGQSGEGQGQGASNCPVHGGHDHDHGDGQGQGQGGKPWDCGSAADGVRRAYEELGDEIDPGVDEARRDLVRQQAAVEIMRASRDRGNVPAGLLRAARDLVDPVVDWRKELAALVRRQVAAVKGRRDYSYSRPSRRQSAMAGSGVILPGMKDPAPPTVAIVIDTSGSMSDDMLTWAVSETQGVLRSTGSHDAAVSLYSCDAHSSESQRIRSISQVKLTGGGGTDMRVGIEAAMTAKPSPDAVVVITDGCTPWPAAPLANGTVLIVALTDENSASSVPPWARTVLVTR